MSLKQIMSFILGICLLVGIIGSVSSFYMEKLSTNILNIDVEQLQIAQDIQVEMLRHRRYEKDFLLNIGDRTRQQDYLQEFQTSAQTMDQYIDQLEKLFIAQNQTAQKKVVSSLSQAHNQYVKNFLRLSQNILNNSSITPQQGNQQMDPLKGDIHSFEEGIEKIFAQINASFAHDKKHIITISRTIVGILLGLTLFSGFFIIYFTIRILKGLKILEHRIVAVSSGDGDLTKRIEWGDNDEFKGMVDGLNSFLDQLHEMIGRIKQNALHIASSTEQIGAAMNQVAKTVEEQASTTEEISASIVEISANSEEVSGNSEQASANVTQISQTVQNLQTGIQYLGEQFELLNGKSQRVYNSTQEGVQWIEESNGIISQMVDSSKIISDRIGSVNDIAEQIKLLALNAAIVAAQAGEHGKGFSVVADAINSLAQQAGKTADEITSTVHANVEIAQKGLAVSQKTLKMMHEIAEDSNESKKIAATVNQRVQEQVISGNEIAVAAGDSAERVHQVSVAMGEQTHAVNQVTEAVDQLASMASETAASVEQVSTSNNELLQVAEGLREMVQRFKINENQTTAMQLR